MALLTLRKAAKLVFLTETETETRTRMLWLYRLIKDETEDFKYKKIGGSWWIDKESLESFAGMGPKKTPGKVPLMRRMN